jgi:hypothetical protein
MIMKSRKFPFYQKSKFLTLTLTFLFLNNSNAATYTMGTSGSQSATITATSGSPDKFYDNGGSGSNYSNNITSVTYTFNCAGGKYVRMKMNLLYTESCCDYFYVYDGATTSDRLIGTDYFSGSDPGDFMYCSTTGSLTIKFETDGSLNYDGWDADVWIDDYPGQLWDGSSNTDIGVAANWEGSVVPYGNFSSIYIPSGLSNYPTISNSTIELEVYDLRIASGGTMTYSTTASGHSIYVYGDMVIDGTFNHSGNYYLQFEGGTSSNYASLSGSGTYTTLRADFGYNRLAYYKILNDMTILDFYLENDLGTAKFDMNNYNLTAYYFEVESSTTFYQKSGILSIEESTPTINNASFDEGTGTTYFSSGTTWTNVSQTVPSITYYNLKVRTNNSYVASIGTGSNVTVGNDFTVVNPGAAGGVATTIDDIVVSNNCYIGNTGNALTLNLADRLYRSSGTGTLTMGNVVAHAINVTYASASNYAISGFGASPTFYGTFTYNSGSAQKVIPATYYDFVSTGTGTKTLYGNIDINGDITLSNGVLSQSTFDINVAENWTSSGNYFLEGTGTVTFDGTAVSNISSTSSSVTSSIFSDACESATGWTLNSGSAAWVLITPTGTNSPSADNSTSGTQCFKTGGASSTYTSTSTYILTSPVIDLTSSSNSTLTFYLWMDPEGTSSNYDGGFIEVFNGTTWVSISGNLAYDATINSGYSNPYGGTSAWCYDHLSWVQVTVDISAYDGRSDFQIRFKFGSDSSGEEGGWAIDDVAVSSNSTYTGEAFNKFAVNKTGGGSVTLGSKILVQTSLTFTDGIITSTSSNYPEFDEDATVAGTPSATCHVNGVIKKRTNTTTPFVFPCGDGSAYRSCEIAASNTNSTTWTNQYFSSAYSDLTVTGISHVSTVEYWTLDRSSSPTPADALITLSWDANSLADEDYTDIVVAHYNGADWETAGGNNHTGNASAGTVESNAAWASYSPFTLGSATGIVPLPITLVSFDAEPNQDNIATHWKTSAEINNDYFTVERSQDGVNFTPIGRVEGAGNSSIELNYMYLDKTYEFGINYYRLKQTDFDGKNSYSEIVTVDVEQENKTIINTVNSLGQEVNQNYKGVVFDIYSDGTSSKRIQ